jgi:hypothetical protein
MHNPTFTHSATTPPSFIPQGNPFPPFQNMQDCIPPTPHSHGPFFHPGFQPSTPFDPPVYSQGLYHQHIPAPIFIAKDPPKLKLPKDWNSSHMTWPLFKSKTEMACQELNMTFLTMAKVTSPQVAEASKKFAEALHSVIPHSALTEFLGSSRDFYCIRGIEMFERLRIIYELTHTGAVTSIIDKLSMIHMEKNETPSEYKLRIELLN